MPPPMAAGELDPSFGEGGIVRDAISGLDGTVQLLVLSGKRLLVAAVVDADLVLARFLPDGRLDPTFGDGGRIRPYDGAEPLFHVSRPEPSADGGLVFGTNLGTRPALMRTTGDGMLDPRFGDGGVVVDERQDAPIPVDLIEDARGRLVTAGGSANTATLARYLADGTPDTSFGRDGLVQVPPDVAGARCHLSSVIEQPDGHLVAGGTCYSFPPSQPLLVRLDPDGAGEPERLLPRETLPGIHGVNEIAALDDGRFLVSMFDQPAVASFTPDGVGREDFGTHGLSPYLPGAKLTPLTLDAAERPVAAGYFIADPFNVYLQLAVGRFTSGGLPDASFGNDGLVVTPFEAWSSAADVVVQDDGKIVVAAVVGREAVLLRYSGGSTPP